jgi:hypothetical protein
MEKIDAVEESKMNSKLSEESVPVVTTESVSSGLTMLTMPFVLDMNIQAMTEIVESVKPKLFFLQFKKSAQISLSKVTMTMFDMIDNFFMHYQHFNKILMGTIPAIEDIYSPTNRRMALDPLGVSTIMTKLQSASFEYSQYNPVYVANRHLTTILNLGGVDQGDGRVEVAVEALLPLSDYERRCYRSLHDSNMMYLTKADYKRQYMSVLDDEREYTLPRPVGEEQIFTWYFLPRVVPLQMDRIIRFNRTVLPSIWERKKMMIEKALSVKGVPISATFEDLANVLRIRTSEFSTKNSLAKSISLGRGTAWLTKYVTTLLWNRWFVMHMELDFTTFNLETIIECICMKMLCTESSLSPKTRKQVNNYLSTYLFANMRSMNDPLGVDGPIALQGIIPVANRYDANPFLVGIFNQFALRTGAGIVVPVGAVGPHNRVDGVDTVRNALHHLFGTWSRGIAVSADEIPGVVVPNVEIIENLPEDLGTYHTNPGSVFVPLTQKNDHHWDELWLKSQSLEIFIKAIERGNIRFSNRDPRVNQDLVFLLARLNKQIYDLQGFAIDFNNLLRKLAFIPDTLMLTEVASRNLEVGNDPFQRSLIDIRVGDVSSAYLAVKWSDASISMPVQDLCDDAWSSLQSVDEFKANYDIISNFALEFVGRYPTYQRFYTEPDLINSAWKHVQNKHPMAVQLAEEFKLYNNRVFTRFDTPGIPVDQIRRNKLQFVHELWSQHLNAGRLGIQDRFILKPSARAVQGGANEIYRWIDVFREPDVPHRYTFQQYIDAVKRGIARARPEDQQVENSLGEILAQSDVTISGVWLNINVGGQGYYDGLQSILNLAEQIPVLGVGVPYKWRDLRDHIELDLYRNLPAIGILEFPMRNLTSRDWTRPWYTVGSFDGAIHNTKVLIRHSFIVIMKVERVLRN